METSRWVPGSDSHDVQSPPVGVLQEGPKSHPVGEGAVVDEEGHRPAARGPIKAREPSGRRSLHLVGGDDGKRDPLLGQHIQGRAIHRRLREPHALWGSPEPPPKVGYPPPHFRYLVPLRGQGKDRVVVGLGNGVSVTSEPGSAPRVGFQNCPVGCRCLRLHPVQESRAEVEADELQGVQDSGDSASGSEDAGSDHGPIALFLDSFVPVVVGRGGELGFHRFQPGVVPGRLVEMAVYYR